MADMRDSHASNPSSPRGGNCEKDRRVSFLDLAGELRNRIYELVLADEKGHEVLLRHDPDGSYRASYGTPAFSSRTSMALAQTCKQIRREFRPLSMKKIYAVVPLHSYASFLQAFFFTGLPLHRIIIYVPYWTEGEIGLRPLIVAASTNASSVRVLNTTLNIFCGRWAEWKKLLLSGYLCNISFQMSWECGPVLICTISKELGELWNKHGYSAIHDGLPEIRFLCTEYSVFKSEAWPCGEVRRTPKPFHNNILRYYGEWDNHEESH